jgi:hypothetical protein
MALDHAALDQPGPEIFGYLRSRPVATVLLVLVPVLAAAVTAFFLLKDPKTYTARTTSAVPSGATSATGIVIYQANYGLALHSAEVATSVSRSTGVPARDIGGHLSAGRVGASSLLEVRFEGDSPETAKAVVVAAARATLAKMSSDAVAPAEASVKDAQARSDAAAAALSVFQAQVGRFFPDDDYKALNSQLGTAKSALASAQATGNAAAATTAQNTINNITAQMNALAPIVRQYQPLASTAAAAQSALASATIALANAQADATGTRADVLVGTAGVVADSRVKPVVQGAGAAAVVAFVGALLVLVGPDTVRRRRNRRDLDGARRTPGGPDEIVIPRTVQVRKEWERPQRKPLEDPAPGPRT